MVETNEEAQPSSQRRRRETRWKVVASVQPQGSEGLRWVQLQWAPEPVSDWWPARKDRGPRDPGPRSEP